MLALLATTTPNKVVLLVIAGVFVGLALRQWRDKQKK
jgi:hypothetical protein